MKERPILFQASMVRAILAGTKTQTRRLVKPAPAPCDHKPWPGDYEPNWVVDGDGLHCAACGNGHRMDRRSKSGVSGIRCPYGKPGDRLWVKETFFAFGRWETRFDAKKGRDAWHFVDMTVDCDRAYQYTADGAPQMPVQRKRNAGVTPGWWKRPAIFMPRAASRTVLEVTDLRVERLQAISEADATAEGVAADKPVTWWQGYREHDGDLMHQQVTGDTPPDWMVEPHQMKPMKHLERSARDWYQALWNNINGGGSWNANPWVWAVEFKKA